MNELDEEDGKLIKEAISILGDSLKDSIIEEVTSHIPFIKHDTDNKNEL